MSEGESGPRGGARRGDAFVLGGRRAVSEAIRSGAVQRILIDRRARETQGFRAVLQDAAEARLDVEWVGGAELDALGAGPHQAVVAFVALPRPLDDHGLAATSLAPDALVVVLDGVSDPQNLGACARSAEAAGAALLVVRARRAAPITPSAVRASAGALLHLPVARVVNLTRTLESLKDRGFTVVGLDHEAAATIDDPPPEPPLALVVGAEGQGISRLVREACDLLVSIPVAGRTTSLNAAAALAVALFGYARRPGPGVRPSGGTMP